MFKKQTKAIYHSNLTVSALNNYEKKKFQEFWRIIKVHLTSKIKENLSQLPGVDFLATHQFHLTSSGSHLHAK
jgi:hypothetical protein